jgi:Tfp pilus assembly major pilin PilA
MCIGFLVAAWTRKRQGLHDFMAGCLVVRKSADTATIASGVIAPPVSGGAIAGIIAAACFVIALPVIGILAVIAIPQYQEYVNRSKLTQIYQLTRPAQAAVSKYYAKNEAVPATLAEAGFVTPVLPEIGDVTIDAEGVISVTLATASLDGQSLLFIPEVNGQKELTCTCRSEDIRQKLLPAGCKG